MNCEPWFERGAFVFMVILVAITAKFALIVSCPKRKTLKSNFANFCVTLPADSAPKHFSPLHLAITEGFKLLEMDSVIDAWIDHPSLPQTLPGVSGRNNWMMET
ncbi:hypothetical protein M405DRAFT_406502 [Rhizopogon salebrosus TDB-379]|nr:hypothetical protein M405DRAFT_406502 [Rhizopogon salebrosus TDB-379]